jgi:hypothetical protein
MPISSSSDSRVSESLAFPPQSERFPGPVLSSEVLSAIAAGKIDEILAWEQRSSKETERDTKFVKLGRFLCEVRAGQYWRLEDLKCFDEFLERRFPGKAYYLMSIHEHRTSAAASEKTAEGSGLDEGNRVSQVGQEGQAALRLCNLVAPGTGNAQEAGSSRRSRGN